MKEANICIYVHTHKKNPYMELVPEAENSIDKNNGQNISQLSENEEKS